MSFRYEVFCPAKLNLFLAVGKLDARGYHPIRTVFQSLNFGDLVIVEPGEDEVEFIGEEVPVANTVSRTLRLLREIAPIPALKVTVHKRIPSQAGLGGASTDAAGLLRATWKLAPFLPKPEMAGIAQAVGADVSFFLVGGRARGEGYGEVLTPLADSTIKHVVLIKPNVDCPTGPMYGRLDALEFPFREFPNDDDLYNDFERVAPCESMDWAERLQVHGSSAAGLSGSGSAVFGLFETAESAESASQALKAEGAPFVHATRFATRLESLHIK